MKNSFHILIVIVVVTTVISLMILVNYHLREANESTRMAYIMAYQSTTESMSRVVSNPTDDTLAQLASAIAVENYLFESLVHSNFFFMNKEAKAKYSAWDEKNPIYHKYFYYKIELNPKTGLVHTRPYNAENYDEKKKIMLRKIVRIRNKIRPSDLLNKRNFLCNKLLCLRTYNVVDINAVIYQREQYFDEVLESFPELSGWPIV